MNLFKKYIHIYYIGIIYINILLVNIFQYKNAFNLSSWELKK